MPAAIPIAAAVIPSVIGAVATNGQNKANQKNATNAAASANQQDQQALAAALARLQQYTQSNPAPLANAAPIQGPASTYGQSSGTMGGGTVGGANGGTVTPAAPAQTQGSAPAANAAAAPAPAQTQTMNPTMIRSILQAMQQNTGGNQPNFGGDYSQFYENMGGKNTGPIKRTTLGSAL